MNSTEKNPEKANGSLRRPTLIISTIILILIAGLIIAFFYRPKAGQDTQKVTSQSITMPAAKKIISPTPPAAITENAKLDAASSDNMGEIADTTSPGVEKIPTKTDVLSATNVNEGKTDEPVSSSALAEKTSPSPLPLKTTDQPEADARKKVDTSSGKKASLKKSIKIETRVSQEEFTLDILTDGDIRNYNHFFLESPPRLVIDLIGKWEKPDSTGISVTSNLVKKIRIWPHPDKLRIVSDLQKEELQAPLITPLSNGLSVTLKKK